MICIALSARPVISVKGRPSWLSPYYLLLPGQALMPNFATTLKTEIARLARKEIRTQVEPLKKATAAQRREITELKRQIVALTRQAGAAGKRPAPKTDSQPAAASARFSAKGLKTLRLRLGLSAAEFGKLAGASGQSIYGWEAGKTLPRAEQRERLAGLRLLGKKEARARLLAE